MNAMLKIKCTFVREAAEKSAVGKVRIMCYLKVQNRQSLNITKVTNVAFTFSVAMRTALTACTLVHVVLGTFRHLRLPSLFRQAAVVATSHQGCRHTYRNSVSRFVFLL